MYDQWGRPIRPGPPRHYRSSVHASGYVDNDAYDYEGADLHRARSSGHGRAPNINIYNDIVNDVDNVDERTQSPRGRAHLRPGEGYDAPRPRSRSRSAINPDDLDFYRRSWKLQAKEEEEEARKREEEAISRYRHDEERHEEDRKEMVRQALRDEEEKKKKEADRRKEILRQAREEEEEEKRKAIERKKQILLEAELEEKEKKEKEKKQLEELLRKKKEEEEKEKEKKEKAKQEYIDRVNKDFGKFGLTEKQIKTMVEWDEKEKKGQLSPESHGHHYSRTLEVGRPRSNSHLERPTFPKIHRHDISIETLDYYDLEWDYDKHDRDYIIIKHELSVSETDMLFDHTKSLKSRKLLTDGRRHEENNYAWIKKTHSKTRGKSRERSHSGIREKFAEAVVRRM